jgi:hypothetical protein
MSTAGFHYTFTWRNLFDPCKRCYALRGYTWTDADIYDGVLWHPIWGDVWNLDLDLPLTHGGSGINCKCFLDIQTTVVWNEIKELEDLGIIFEIPINETEEMNDIVQIDTLREKIGDLKGDLLSLDEPIVTAREGTRVLYRFNAVLAHMGLPPDINAAVRKFQQIVFMARMAQMSLTFMEMSTPYGWVMGGLGAASVALSASNFMMTMGE